MNAVGIDVSKGKSTVAIMRPFGEVVAEPFEVSHTDADLRKLACFLEKLPGKTRIVMEYTGSYWQPIAKVLHDAGLFVSAVNALLIYKYGNNSIRKGKTDKLDALKIANYCLDRWTDLERYAPADQIRQTLKTLFQVMSTIIQHAPADDPVFQFLDRKRQEGKHYYVYMTAAANKFLRIYYGTVTAYLEKL